MALTLDDVISFISRNEGRKVPTIGGRAEFSARRRGNTKTIIFVTENGSHHHESFDWIKKSLKIFNATGSFKTTDYQSTNTRAASYTLGLFREIQREQKLVVDSNCLLSEDLKKIVSDKKIEQTTKQALIAARVGQGKFRDEVLALWGNRCCVTNSTIKRAIRASHIKPWRDSTNEERLDPANGIPLVASLDALFDAGLISFEDSGAMCISKELNESERRIYGIIDRTLGKAPPPETLEYLKHHRNHRFKP